MGETAQKRAIRQYRARLTERGFARFEIMALRSDRELFRALAKHLAEDGPQADQVRAALKTAIAPEPAKPGGILQALRRSPLVAADLDLERRHDEDRKIDL
jgi:hypothetical protein